MFTKVCTGEPITYKAEMPGSIPVTRNEFQKLKTVLCANHFLDNGEKVFLLGTHMHVVYSFFYDEHGDVSKENLIQVKRAMDFYQKRFAENLTAAEQTAHIENLDDQGSTYRSLLVSPILGSMFGPREVLCGTLCLISPIQKETALQTYDLDVFRQLTRLMARGGITPVTTEVYLPRQRQAADPFVIYDNASQRGFLENDERKRPLEQLINR
jgi:hypothetical protein